jgi:hypothetical protein
MSMMSPYVESRRDNSSSNTAEIPCSRKPSEIDPGLRYSNKSEFYALFDGEIDVALMMHRLAPGVFEAQPALPVASPAVTSGTAAELVLAGGGKVTPVRYEYGQQDGSGLEEGAAHLCVRFR